MTKSPSFWFGQTVAPKAGDARTRATQVAARRTFMALPFRTGDPQMVPDELESPLASYLSHHAGLVARPDDGGRTVRRPADRRIVDRLALRAPRAAGHDHDQQRPGKQ